MRRFFWGALAIFLLLVVMGVKNTTVSYAAGEMGTCFCKGAQTENVSREDCFSKFGCSTSPLPVFGANDPKDVGDCSCAMADKMEKKTGITREKCAGDAYSAGVCKDGPKFLTTRKYVDYCCCRVLDDGTTCVELSNFYDDRKCGKDGFSDGNKYPDAANSSFKVYDVPISRNCADYAAGGKKTAPKSTTAGAGGDDLSVDKLQKQAAGLNQFTQFANTDPAQLGAAFIGVGVKILLSFIGALSLLLYVIAGVLWMTAQGKSEQIQKSKTILLWTTLGIVAMLSSYLVVSGFFGLFRKP